MLVLTCDNIIIGMYKEVPKDVIEKYFDDCIESDKYRPMKKYTCDTMYTIEENGNIYTLLKTSRVIKKGYMYNESRTDTTVLCQMSLLTYDKFDVPPSSMFTTKLTQSLNNRILNSMDRDSLLQFVTKLNIGEENIYKISRALEIHKKALYSDVASKLSRYGSRI
jgi:hypothetical protein